jgi:hypothetical protein
VGVVDDVVGMMEGSECGFRGSSDDDNQAFVVDDSKKRSVIVTHFSRVNM